MQVIIHRGSHQIGGSCIEVRSKKARIIFDIGDELPDIDNPDKPRIIPVVDNLFVDSHISNQPVAAIFISHNHGDHLGLLDQLREEVSVYIGKIAADIYNTIGRFTVKGATLKPYDFLNDRETIRIQDIEITPYLVDHSAYDSYGFVIRSEGKQISYTGDFRSHGSKHNYTSAFADHARGSSALLIEGTNLYKDGFQAQSEERIGEKIADFMRSVNGNIFVLQSSANIDRIDQVIDACDRTGRTMVVDIFTYHILANIPGDKYNGIKIFYPLWLTKKMHESTEGTKMMNRFSKRKLPNEELHKRTDLCILVRENMLWDIENRMVLSNAGLIYSKWTGYKSLPKVAAFLKFFNDKGLPVVELHTSGHADELAIRQLVETVQPTRILPIHSETPEKYESLFGDIVYLPNDGEVIDI